MTYENHPDLNKHFRFRGHPQKKNGGTPGSARQEVIAMDTVMEMPLLNKGKKIVSSNSPHRTASMWLDEQIIASQNGIITQHIDLTPDLARVLLARNPDNRRVSDAVVANYARDIANGAWSDNGQTIVISKDGRLNDGQHRCEAVVMADQAIRAILVFGTDRESRFTLDQGKVRLVADYLSMNGHIDGAGLGTIAKLFWQYQTHGRISQQIMYRPTKGELLGTIEAYPGLTKSLAFATKKGVEAVGGRSVVGFCHFVISAKAGPAAAAEFIDRLISGEDLTAGHPILNVRNRMIPMRGRLRIEEKVELILRCWNAYRKGESRTLFRVVGDLPRLER